MPWRWVDGGVGSTAGCSKGSSMAGEEFGGSLTVVRKERSADKAPGENLKVENDQQRDAEGVASAVGDGVVGLDRGEPRCLPPLRPRQLPHILFPIVPASLSLVCVLIRIGLVPCNQRSEDHGDHQENQLVWADRERHPGPSASSPLAAKLSGRCDAKERTVQSFVTQQ
eukprot:m.306824 g.306824  ORF g.306824 m.306824 type:complete len:169 (-) comp16354_c0_seq6:2044-2550(-)